MVLDADLRRRVVQAVEGCIAPQPEGATGLLALLASPAAQADAEAYVGVAHDVLWLKLQAPHSQTRLLALQLADRLFVASRPFRRRVCANFQTFLELTVGHAASRPLPPPVNAAEALRARALEVVERWCDAHGRTCPQVVAGARFLHDVLGLRLPELRARAAARAAHTAERRGRARELDAQQAADVPGALVMLEADAQPLLAELATASALLRGGAPPQDDGVTCAAEQAGGAGVTEDEWEDVAPPPARWRRACDGGDSGLAAYATAAAAASPDTGAGAAAGGADADAEGAEAHDLDRDTTRGLTGAARACARALAGTHVPRLQGWLRLLARLPDEALPPGSGGGGGGSGARGGGGCSAPPPLLLPGERDRLLREVVTLRNRIQDALAAAAAAGVDVPPEALSRGGGGGGVGGGGGEGEGGEGGGGGGVISVTVTLPESGGDGAAGDGDEESDYGDSDAGGSESAGGDGGTLWKSR
ncbi:hypothetical protein FOA52_016090 [Chlamydomonas sp. UWO 241]|nr:hypothetical protein FOA52_016090 [Chlamydomonas sp. UWO 241]